jgi:hypothetical protein
MHKNLLSRSITLHPLNLEQKPPNVSDLFLVPCFYRVFQGSFIKFLCHIPVTFDLVRCSMRAHTKWQKVRSRC